MMYLLLFPVHAVFSNKSIECLQRFGYVDEHNIEDSIVPEVKLFQETFYLAVDGILNNETLRLMKIPRCGNNDDLIPVTASHKNKWSTKEVNWYMYDGVQSSTIIERALNLRDYNIAITQRH